MQCPTIFNKIWPLCFSSFFSKTGEFAYEIVFALLAIEFLDSNYFYLGLVYFVRFMPYVFFGAIGGWIADSYPQKNNMLFSEFFRLGVAASLSVFYINDSLNVYVLIISSMLITVGRSLFQPSFRSYLPTALEQKDLPVANSVLQIIEDIASIIGPLAGALFISLGGKVYVIYMYPITYVLSVFMLVFLRTNLPSGKKKLSLLDIFCDAKTTASQMRAENPNLFFVIAGTSMCVLFTASLLRFVLPSSIMNVYDDEALVGYIYSVMSLGTVVGGFCYVRIVRHSSPIQLMTSWMIYGVFFLATSIAISVHFVGVLLMIFFLGFCGAIVDISIITNIQFLSLKGDLGKNYALYSTLANASEAVSGLISGLFFILLGGASFSVISLLITVSAKTVISRIKRIEYEWKR